MLSSCTKETAEKGSQLLMLTSCTHWLFPGCSGPLCTHNNLKIQTGHAQAISQNQACINSAHKIQVPIIFNAMIFSNTLLSS